MVLEGWHRGSTDRSCWKGREKRSVRPGTAETFFCRPDAVNWSVRRRLELCGSMARTTHPDFAPFITLIFDLYICASSDSLFIVCLHSAASIPLILCIKLPRRSPLRPIQGRYSTWQKGMRFLFLPLTVIYSS